jgi:hypothetical protein
MRRRRIRRVKGDEKGIYGDGPQLTSRSSGLEPTTNTG